MTLLESLKKGLRSIGKKIGVDLAYLVKNGSWVTLRFFVLALGGWVVSLCFARLGSKDLLGQYQFVISILSMVSVVSLPGLNAAALEAVVKGRDAAVIKAVKISFLSSLLGVPIVAGFGLYNIYFHEPTVGEVLIFSALLFPIFYALNTWQSYYEGKSLFGESSKRLIILNVVLALALVAGIILKIGLLGLVTIFLGVHILFFGIFFKKILTKIHDKTQDALDVEFGVRVSLQKFVFGLSTNLPPIAISFLFTTEAVAIYYIAAYLISAIFAFLGNLFSLYIPNLFKGVKIHHRNIVFQNIFVGIAAWVCFLIFLRFFFLIMYGEEYRESLRIAYAISFLLLLVPLKTYFINFFMTQKRNWILIIAVSIANSVAFGIFYFTKDLGFYKSVIMYLYALELLTTLPLLVIYISLIHKEKRKL